MPDLFSVMVRRTRRRRRIVTSVKLSSKRSQLNSLRSWEWRIPT
jgi:hypothetical protein